MANYRNIEVMKWHEAIRKRPGMYLGNVNHRGLSFAFRRLVSEILEISECRHVSFTFIATKECIIEFRGINAFIKSDLAILDKDLSELPILNALSKSFELTFLADEDVVQKFKRGISSSLIIGPEINCSGIEIHFELDEDIWDKSFRWKYYYLVHEIRDYSFLNRTVFFEVRYTSQAMTHMNNFRSENGLLDRLEIEILNGLGSSFFQHHLDKEFDDFQLECAFAFREYTVDSGFIRTYVNDELTSEHRNHLDAVLKGLTFGVMKYFQANELINDYKISEKGIREGLLCLINIKMINPVFSGCVKNKLANPEIIEPIASFISQQLFSSILRDQDSTDKLIDRFRI